MTSEDPMLLDDLATTSDLKSKVDQAWREFASALAGAIAEMKPGVQLEITLDPTASGTGHAVYEVSVQRRPDGALGALAVGNAALPEGHRLDRAAVANMVVLGWSPPGVIEGSGRRLRHADLGRERQRRVRHALCGDHHQDAAGRLQRPAPGVPHLHRPR